MNESLHIYRIKVSRFKERPKLDLDHPKYLERTDFTKIVDIQEGELGLEEYEPLEFYTDDPGALEWDAFWPALELGLISPRAKEIIQPFADQYFIFLEASLNDNLYFVLIVNERLDCFDRENSEFMTFADLARKQNEDKATIDANDELHIFRTEKYRFKKELIPDPCMFSVPEINGEVFITESGKNAIEQAGLKGFEFLLLD